LPSLMLKKVIQSFPRPRLGDVEKAVEAELAEFRHLIKPGTSISIAVGSRGVANSQVVVRTVVAWLKHLGARPFIIPAMGSHGNATAQGQTAVLASYGITEDGVGAPIKSTMETVDLTPRGFMHGVYMDRYAYESDGVILINRVKVHTDFHGPYESGVVKLSVIGLGKHRQALEIHSYGVYGLRERIPETAKVILGSGKVLLGVGLVENAYDETMIVQAMPADEIMADEPALLQISRENMPHLPVDRLDVLIIDRFGKDISGTCIDPNIVGRMKIRGEEEPELPDIKAIVATDITPASHGNVVGVGFADVITRRAYEKIDFDATYENTVTSSFLERGKLPVCAPDDATAYRWALRSCGKETHAAPRVLRIRDTLHLIESYASPSVIEELRNQDSIAITGDFIPAFDNEGNLLPF
jgi:hypothetical protein